MKVGTRLTVVLLMALTPVVAGYTSWSINRSTRIYTHDLKRETRATCRSLLVALDSDVEAADWQEVGRVLERISAEGTAGAVFDSSGALRYALPDFPRGLIPMRRHFASADRHGFAEFEQWVGGRYWFCQLASFRQAGLKSPGYLLAGQDWTEVTEDLRERTTASIIAALLMMALVAALIPLAIRRYVSEPLAELSRRVTRFSSAEETTRALAGDEVRLLTEEFRRLDHQLAAARTDLLKRHHRELVLERKLQHADRLATIGTLASGLAHEIGTPLGIIRGRAEYLLGRSGSDGKVRDVLAIIVHQIDRISNIVRMLLDYARARESLRVACDLRRIVEHSLDLVETEAARRKARVLVNLGSRPLEVRCDSDQLQQVFVNLAMNALDSMASGGGGTLTVTAESLNGEESPQLKVVFEDTGPGVAPEHRGRIFDPFFTTKEPGKGTGMGLAVSQSIMHDHGGEIALESGDGVTRFVVTIPAEPGTWRDDTAAEPKDGT